jgi:hypothetical protein
LPPGTVKFDIIIAQNIMGVVAEEPTAFRLVPVDSIFVLAGVYAIPVSKRLLVVFKQ